MSVIIRLQNLAWSANALDIRRLFHGLCIPDGGVHIVGGENGDAFIAFSTDEDARKAMHMDGALLLQNPIKLYLSSKNEMQNVIAIARGSAAPDQPNGGGPPRHGMQDNMGHQGFNQAMDRDRNQLPPPQMGFQAPPGPQFGRGPEREEQFTEDRNYSRPSMSGSPSRRGGFQYDRGQEPMGRPGPGRDNFMRDDFGPPQQDRNMHDCGPPMGRDETRVVRGGPHGHNFGPDSDARPPKQGILGDSPMGFGPPDDGPPRKILLADPVPDHRPVLAGNFPPEGMMGRMEGQDEDYMRRPHDRDRWEPNGDDFRGRRDRGDRYNRFDNPPDRRRFDDNRHGGPRDRSPLRREHGANRDRRPVQPFAAGADEHNVFVYVRNMPTNISYRDVRRFFSGCPIPSTGLKMINDEHGRRTGEAYVMFSSEQVTADALKKDGDSMSGLVVQVGPSTKEDFETAVDSYIPNRPQRREPSPNRPSKIEPSRSSGGSGSEYFVEIRNIPFRAVRAEIRQFFSKLHICPGGGPIMDFGNDGRFNGVIYLQLQDHRDLREALDMNGRDFMGRTVELVEVRRRIFEEKSEKEKNKGREREEGRGDRNREHDREDKEKEREGEKKADVEAKSSPVKSKPAEKFFCVKLHGLPYLANNIAVKDFFNGLEIAQRGIHLMHNERHQCTGTGYVEFVTSADCDKACCKNKEYMGKRFILVEPITKRDMLDSMAKDRSESRPRGSADCGRGRGRGMGSGGRGASNDGFGRDRVERTSRFTSERLFEPQGFNSGEMYDERRVERDFDHGNSDYQEESVDNYGGMDDMALDNAVVVAMYNVPYRATPPDIVDFFQGFPVDPHSVQMLQTGDGRRTGEVNVSFPSVEDAAMAVQQLDHQDFLGRAVELCIL